MVEPLQLQTAAWALTTALELSLFVQLLRRKLARIYPFFLRLSLVRHSPECWFGCPVQISEYRQANVLEDRLGNAGHGRNHKSSDTGGAQPKSALSLHRHLGLGPQAAPRCRSGRDCL